jgi:hypothetical protein
MADVSGIELFEWHLVQSPQTAKEVSLRRTGGLPDAPDPRGTVRTAHRVIP